MSAIVGRVILAVGIGLVAAIVYSFKNRREQHTHHGGRGGGVYDDADYRSRPSWGHGDYPDDDDGDDSHCSRRKASNASRISTETKGEGEKGKEPTSVQASCPICLDTFQFLKRKGVPIYTTPCGHLFCHKCLKQSVAGSQACPTCRVHILYRNCHQIFL